MDQDPTAEVGLYSLYPDKDGCLPRVGLDVRVEASFDPKLRLTVLSRSTRGCRWPGKQGKCTPDSDTTLTLRLGQNALTGPTSSFI